MYRSPVGALAQAQVLDRGVLGGQVLPSSSVLVGLEVTVVRRSDGVELGERTRSHTAYVVGERKPLPPAGAVSERAAPSVVVRHRLPSHRKRGVAPPERSDVSELDVEPLYVRPDLYDAVHAAEQHERETGAVRDAVSDGRTVLVARPGGVP